MKIKTIDINELIIKDYIESIRPEKLEIRKQLDFGYTYEDGIAVLFEIRPIWNKPKEIQHLEFARIRCYKSKQEWHLYWMRASGKWESYEPFPMSINLEQIINILKEDKHGCFYG